MSDPKASEDKDIIAKADDQPMELSDEELEGVDAGFGLTRSQAVTIDAQFGKDFMTIDAAGMKDQINTNAETFFGGMPTDKLVGKIR